jgi:hypothetical protein
MDFKKNLEDYKLQQIANLRNMKLFAYGRVRAEKFDDNVVVESSDDAPDDSPNDADDAQETLVLTLDDHQDAPNHVDESMKFEQNRFNNTYTRTRR